MSSQVSRVDRRWSTRLALLTVLAPLGVGLLACSGHEANSEPDLTGAWIPREVNGGPLEPGLDPRTAAIDFADDGTWQASDGCHPLHGTYEVEGSQFDGGPVTNGVIAGIGCPRGELAYGEVLPRVSRVEHSGDTLQFFDGDGNSLLELKAQD